MQSFLQYKRYKKAVQSQYARDKAKFDQRFPRAVTTGDNGENDLALALAEKQAKEKSTDTLNQSDQQMQPPQR